MNVFVVKYALTNGITEKELIEDNGKYAFVRWPEHYNGRMMLTSKEWASDKAAAIELANYMRKRKIASLQKQIKKLEGITW